MNAELTEAQISAIIYALTLYRTGSTEYRDQTTLEWMSAIPDGRPKPLIFPKDEEQILDLQNYLFGLLHPDFSRNHQSSMGCSECHAPLDACRCPLPVEIRVERP